MFGKDQGSGRTPSPAAPAASSVQQISDSAPLYGASSQPGELNALLGRGSSFEGKLTFEGTVRIDGRFKGNIVANDILIIGDEGVVEGEITVGEIISSGVIKGTIHAARAAEFLAPGKVEAELFTASLRIERGVVFDGEIHMKNQESSKEKKSRRPASEE